MPTDTFFRLPEEKRTRILEGAWSEFTAVPYAEASINRIVQTSRIPRGSFYQYFEDKNDLFLTLIDELEKLLGTRKEFLLGRWLGDARRMGKTQEEKNLYEHNARNLIGCWGDRTYSLFRILFIREGPFPFEVLASFFKSLEVKLLSFFEGRDCLVEEHLPAFVVISRHHSVPLSAGVVFDSAVAVAPARARGRLEKTPLLLRRPLFKRRLPLRHRRPHPPGARRLRIRSSAERGPEMVTKLFLPVTDNSAFLRR